MTLHCPMRILEAVMVTALAFDASASPLVTQKCNTRFGSARVTIRAEPNALSELLAIATDPKRDPETYDRLWRPHGERGYGTEGARRVGRNGRFVWVLWDFATRGPHHCYRIPQPFPRPLFS